MKDQQPLPIESTVLRQLPRLSKYPGKCQRFHLPITGLSPYTRSTIPSDYGEAKGANLGCTIGMSDDLRRTPRRVPQLQDEGALNVRPGGDG
jgi:hypothetical protein